MIRISRLTDYGIQLLAAFAKSPEKGFNASDLSIFAAVPVPTVRKLLKSLSKAGLLVSRRGVSGGYSLARAPESITVAEVVTALEGPVALTECNVPGGDSCDRSADCPLRSNWKKVNDVVAGALAGLTISQMVGPLPPGWPAARGGNP